MTILSLASWTSELATLPAAKAAAVSERVRTAGFYCQGQARIRCPVDTGFLRNSISVGNPNGSTTKPGDLEVEVGPEAAYGAYVEFGTSRMAGRPYMTPAAELSAQWLYEQITRLADE